LKRNSNVREKLLLKLRRNARMLHKRESRLVLLRKRKLLSRNKLLKRDRTVSRKTRRNRRLSRRKLMQRLKPSLMLKS